MVSEFGGLGRRGTYAPEERRVTKDTVRSARWVPTREVLEQILRGKNLKKQEVTGKGDKLQQGFISEVHSAEKSLS